MTAHSIHSPDASLRELRIFPWRLCDIPAERHSNGAGSQRLTVAAEAPTQWRFANLSLAGPRGTNDKRQARPDDWVSGI
jgi:hypothetical protein